MCVRGEKDAGQEDLGMETDRPLWRAQSETSEQWEERMAEESGILMEVAMAVTVTR